MRYIADARGHGPLRRPVFGPWWLTSAQVESDGVGSSSNALNTEELAALVSSKADQVRSVMLATRAGFEVVAGALLFLKAHSNGEGRVSRVVISLAKHQLGRVYGDDMARKLITSAARLLPQYVSFIETECSSLEVAQRIAILAKALLMDFGTLRNLIASTRNNR